MKKEPLKVHLDADLADWIRNQATVLRCSVSQVIRTLVLNAMKKR